MYRGVRKHQVKLQKWLQEQQTSYNSITDSLVDISMSDTLYLNRCEYRSWRHMFIISRIYRDFIERNHP